MKLKDIYNNTSNDSVLRPFSAKLPVISFEIFPPKGEGEIYQQRLADLFKELSILKQFNPAFISITYGAGGSTQEKTFDIMLKIKKELDVTSIPHFTCVGSNRDEIQNYIKKIENVGIKNILALRGDPPMGETKFKKPKNGFGYANELVEFIKQQTNLSIAIAGYPEKHPEAASIEIDIENLKRKVDAGADVIITQVFFDNSYFFNFLTRVERAGLNLPVIPGISPITSLAQVEKMSTLCGSKMPDALKSRLIKHQDNPEAIKELGIEFAIYQCTQLIDFGVKGIHFYPLNKSFAVKEVLENIYLQNCEISSMTRI
ncbi:MAG: methylenetetrahydrofolate reductase [NAD(P)H] [Candidatus Gastranaerophilaceae bacterium]|jgi:methylenetetrahydrofolate reductase (NADPH)